jgi:hypothetical protein
MEARRWTPDEAQKELNKSVIVTRQQIEFAKMYLLKLSRIEEYEPLRIIEQFATIRGCVKPKVIVIHPSVDVEAEIKEAAGYFGSTMACAESVLSLIHDGVFLPISNNSVTDIDNRIEWTTVVPGSGGYSSGWVLEHFRIQVPIRVAFAPSRRSDSSEFLSDPGLYVVLTKIEGADADVIEAIKDSINCFRHELFRAAVVLLGKAMEGAWIEVGVALAKSVPDGTSFNRTKFLEDIFSDSSVIRKASDVLSLYKNKEYVGNVVNKYGIPAAEIENIVVWSEVLRDSRNAVHYGVKPVIPNNYEKVAVLLLAGADNLSKLYHIKRTAQTPK